MAECWICKGEASAENSRTVGDPPRKLLVHKSCLDEFAAIAREAFRDGGSPIVPQGLERVARSVNGKIILVHKNFPNDQFPILVYVAHHATPVSVPEVYEWLRQNELGIENPSLALLRLGRKGWVTTFHEGENRFALITDEGRRALSEYTNSLG